MARILFVGVFLWTTLWQNQARAEDILPAYSEVVAQSVVVLIQNNSKSSDLMPLDHFRTSKDKELGLEIQKSMDENRQKIRVTRSGSTLKFSDGGAWHADLLIQDPLRQRIQINGVAIDLRSYKTLEAKYRLVERILQTSKTSAASPATPSANQSANQSAKQSANQWRARFLFGQPAQAFVVVIVAAIAIVAWLIAGGEWITACLKHEWDLGWCRDKAAVIGNSVAEMRNFAVLKTGEGLPSGQLSCRKPMNLHLEDEQSHVIYDSLNPKRIDPRFQTETNIQTGNMSYSTIAGAAKNCCEADPKSCEAAFQHTFAAETLRGTGGSSSGGSSSGATGSD